jgi:hypothetical protein
LNEKTKIDDRTNKYNGANRTLLSMMYLTLVDEYGKNDCLVEHGEGFIGITIDYTGIFQQHLGNFVPEDSALTKHHEELYRVIESLIECLKSEQKIFIIPFNIKLKNYDSHSNILIYRILDEYNHQIDHYEPHGDKMGMFDDLELNDAFNKEIYDTMKLFTSLMSKDTGKKVVYKKASEICPKRHNGLQRRHWKNERENWGRFCTLWSILIAELTLLAPNCTTKQINDYVNTYDNDLDSILKGYLITLDERLFKADGGENGDYSDYRYLVSMKPTEYQSNKMILNAKYRKEKKWYSSLNPRITKRKLNKVEVINKPNIRYRNGFFRIAIPKKEKEFGVINDKKENDITSAKAMASFPYDNKKRKIEEKEFGVIYDKKKKCYHFCKGNDQHYEKPFLW